MSSFSQKDVMLQLVSLGVDHLGKKIQPYRTIPGFSVNEHLKIKFLETARKSHTNSTL